MKVRNSFICIISFMLIRVIDGMAAVLGHEVAHQLARHSAEKLSFAKVILALQLTLVLFGIEPSFVFNRVLLNVVLNKPFSRKCETEADVIGLQLMAQACFNPHEAVAMWRRMEKAGGGDIPQFISTHPSHKNRIEFLEKEVSCLRTLNMLCLFLIKMTSCRCRPHWRNVLPVIVLPSFKILQTCLTHNGCVGNI